MRSQWAKWTLAVCYLQVQQKRDQKVSMVSAPHIPDPKEWQPEGQDDRWHEPWVTFPWKSCSHNTSSGLQSLKLYPKGGSKMESPMPHQHWEVDKEVSLGSPPPKIGREWETVFTGLLVLPCAREDPRAFHQNLGQLAIERCLWDVCRDVPGG